MSKIIYYYGVEENIKKNQEIEDYNSKTNIPGHIPFKHYNKGVYGRVLEETDNEEEIRKQIEEKCRANPDGRSPIGIKTPHFYWINDKKL